MRKLVGKLTTDDETLGEDVHFVVDADGRRQPIGGRVYYHDRNEAVRKLKRRGLMVDEQGNVWDEGD